jgi:hypothetical protein
MAREAQLKRWSNAKKTALISGAHSHLKQLSRCRTHWGQPGIQPMPATLVSHV